MKIGSRVMHILNRGNMFIVSFLALFRGPTYSIHVLLLYDRLSIFVVNPQVYCCSAVGLQDRYTYYFELRAIPIYFNRYWWK